MSIAVVLCLMSTLAAAVDLGILGDTIKNLPIPGNSGVTADRVKKVVGVGTSLAEAADNQLGPVEEFYLGYEVGARLLASYPTRLPQDSPATQYVTRIGSTVAMGSHAPYLYRPYTFVVLDSTEFNAYAAPGGIIFVTTGVLKHVRNEDELAGVLGHEIAHIELRHGVKTLEQEGFMNFLSTAKDAAVSEAGGNAAMMDQITGPVADKMMEGILNGYSVDQESEADLRSLEICLAAGYDPNAFANLLAKMESSGLKGGGARYPAERAGAAQAKLAEMKAPVAPDSPARTQRFQQAVAGLK
jgi:predicted Zn-dependent protease